MDTVNAQSSPQAAAPTLGQVVARLEQLYPPRLAEPWDAVGLVCGDLGAPVRSVLTTVDVTEAVVEEAVAAGRDLIVAHHPLLHGGVTSVAANTPKGALVHRLITAGVALYTAHTNADKALGGVNDQLLQAFGLRSRGPLVPDRADVLEQFVLKVPRGDADRVLAAAFAAGAGRIGRYDSCAFSAAGRGQFRPLEGSTPTLGLHGEVSTHEEVRCEFVARRRDRAAVQRAILAAHPYETPAVEIATLENGPVGDADSEGLGRIGELARPLSLEAFSRRVAVALPPSAAGIRVAGRPEAEVRTVALCSGAGDSALAAAEAAGVDVYFTADLRHHVVDEARRRTPSLAIIDASHWASEYPWCAAAATALQAGFPGLSAAASAQRTDPWTLCLGGIFKAQ